MRRSVALRCAAAAGAALALAGCVSFAASAPSRFYVLSSLASAADELPTDSSGRAVGVGPIELPKHLDRPQIVTRISPNRLEFGEFDKWGEPLDASVTRVLAENLSVLLRNEKVLIFPWTRLDRVDYRVEMRVTRFMPEADGTVTLRARWALSDDRSGRLITSELSSHRQTASGPGYEARVAAMSRALANLSREIAAAIQAAER